MDVDDIDLNAARQLLQRICKAISLKYRYKVELHEYANGHTYLITADNEIPYISNSICHISLPIPPFNKKSPIYSLCFAGDYKNLLTKMLIPCSKLILYPLGKDKITIDIAEMFGTTIEELNIHLDLLNV